MGSFLNDSYNGKGRLYLDYYKDKVIYDGEFKNGLFDGEGTLFSKENDLPQDYLIAYEGQFKAGKRDGAGIEYIKDNKIPGERCKIEGEEIKKSYEGIMKAYEGTYKNDKKNGHGILITDIEKYDGEFIDDKKCGKGKLFDIHTNKLIYEGEFLDNKVGGKGTQYDKDTGKIVFSGNFCDDSIDYTYTLGMTAQELKNSFPDDSTTDMKNNCIYITYKTQGITFVLKSQPASLLDDNVAKVVEIVLWDNIDFKGITSDIKYQKAVEILGSPDYSGYTIPEYEEILALKNIDSSFNQSNLNKIYISTFYIKGFKTSLAFINENEPCSFIVISK